MSDKPELGSTWVHRSSNPPYVYTVYDITNEHSTNPDYPVSVSYVGKNGRRWSKPLDNFMDRMIQVETPPYLSGLKSYGIFEATSTCWEKEHEG